MRRAVSLLAVMLLSSPVLSAPEGPPPDPDSAAGHALALAKACVGITCRKPGHAFSLRMPNGQTFDTRTDGYPYLDGQGAVLIYPGEAITVALEKQDDKLMPRLVKVDGLDGPVELPGAVPATQTLSFVFRQDDKLGMMLTSANSTDLTLKFDAHMFVPTGSGVKFVPTTICPLLPHQGNLPTFSGLENWPHPIVLLVLTDIRELPPDAPRSCS